MTANGHSPSARLARLETIWQAPPQTCQTCYGRPYRLVSVDETGPTSARTGTVPATDRVSGS